MIINIYATTKKTEDGQFFAVVIVDEVEIAYTYISSLGREDFDEVNAEILALEVATTLAARILLTSHEVNLFHSFDYVLTGDNAVREGDTENPEERFYCVIESKVLENLLFINDANKKLVMIKLPKDENIANLSLEGNDLGYHVDIDDLQITDEELANNYLGVMLNN